MFGWACAATIGDYDADETAACVDGFTYDAYYEEWICGWGSYCYSGVYTE